MLGHVYQGFGQYVKAMESYQKAWETNSEQEVEALFAYAQCCELLMRNDEAKEYYLKVLERDETHAHAHGHLGLLLLGTGVGNFAATRACGLGGQEAIDHLEEALTLFSSLEKEGGGGMKGLGLKKEVEEALAFCREEHEEIEAWEERVALLREEVDFASFPSTFAPPAPAASEVVAVEEETATEEPIEKDTHTHTPQSPHGEDEQPIQALQRTALGHLRAVLRFLRSLSQKITQFFTTLRKGKGHNHDTHTHTHTPEWGPWLNGKKIQSIPSVRITSGEQLMKQYVLQNKPVVIKNFQDAFAGPDAWKRESLKARFGEMPVRVSLSQTGRFDGPENGTLWGLSVEEEVLVRPPQTSMRFGDFVDLLHMAAMGAEIGTHARTRTLTETFYLEYLSVSQYLGEKLVEMIPIPAPAKESGMEHFLTNFWMGKVITHTHTRTHAKYICLYTYTNPYHDHHHLNTHTHTGEYHFAIALRRL